MTPQSWFAFAAYNSQAIYGYGTAEEADRYTDILNVGRDENHYAAHEMTQEEAEEAGLEGPNAGDAGFNLEDVLNA